MDEYNNNIEDPSVFGMSAEERETEHNIIKVIGVGGGGGNTVNYMFAQNIPDINYVVLNTDKQALKNSPVPQKMILGYEITHGRGAGDDPEVGRQCAEASIEDIKKIFDKNTEMVFITAGMGGGTGTGAAPVVARLAREAGLLTIGIVSVPFLFEGERKIIKALSGAKEMQKHVDALLVVNNENLLKIYPDLNWFDAFGKVDDTLANAARSISEIISEECFINVDFRDVKTTLTNSGTAIISTAYGEGEHRLRNAIENALNSPLLNEHDIKTSKRLLMKISIDRKNENSVAIKEVNEIREFTAQLSPTIDVKWGIADDPTLGDKVKITFLASGFDVKINDDIRLTASNTNTPKTETIDFAGDTAPETHEPKGPESDEIAIYYGNDTRKQMDRTRLKMRCIVLKPSEFDDDEVIASIEKMPTAHRDATQNAKIHNLHSENEKARMNPPSTNETNSYGDAIIF